MKSPEHPTPSGDRRMGRLLMAALGLAGHEIRLASEFRSYDGAGVLERQRAAAAAGRLEAERLIAGYRAKPTTAPELWFTYHLYHKAPDWLGPDVARALAIPYVAAEASFAPKQAGGPWDFGHQAAGRQIARAEGIFCLTKLDMACVQGQMAEPGRLHYLPPFTELPPPAGPAARARARRGLAAALGLDPDLCWLIAVAMMRPGDKLESYRRLGRALERLEAKNWQLLVVGDGAARAEVEAALAFADGRVGYAGVLSEPELARAYGAADFCVWPAANEAYGLALLEAAAAGLAVVAGAERGVPDVVIDGRTGLLCRPNDAAGFATAVDRLLGDATLRRRLGAEAARFVRAERGLEGAAARLKAVLGALVR